MLILMEKHKFLANALMDNIYQKEPVWLVMLDAHIVIYHPIHALAALLNIT